MGIVFLGGRAAGELGSWALANCARSDDGVPTFGCGQPMPDVEPGWNPDVGRLEAAVGGVAAGVVATAVGGVIDAATGVLSGPLVTN